MLDRLDRRLENEVPYASSVTFLVNLNIPIGNDEGFETAMNKITPPAMNIFNDSEFQSDKYIIRSAGLSYTEYEEGAARVEDKTVRYSEMFPKLMIPDTEKTN